MTAATATRWRSAIAVPAWPAPAAHGVRVLDDVLPDPAAYRAAALTAPFRSVADGPAVFHGIAPAPAEPLLSVIRGCVPDFVPRWSIFRQSPAGQPEPHFVHSDLSMGDWSAICYLTPDPPANDGTCFWRRADTGAVGTDAMSVADAAYLADGRAWFDASLWEPWYRVPARFNRLLLFPSRLFHARALFDNYGTGDDARLIQVLFGGTA